MKATELRIDNLVSYKDYGTSLIKRISYDGFLDVTPLTFEGRIGVMERDIEPILLTESWLIRFGFRKIDNEHSSFFAKEWGINGVEIVKWSNIYNAFMYELGQAKEKHIEFCHQLQNLFHALTASELEAKHKEG